MHHKNYIIMDAKRGIYAYIYQSFQVCDQWWLHPVQWCEQNDSSLWTIQNNSYFWKFSKHLFCWRRVILIYLNLVKVLAKLVEEVASLPENTRVALLDLSVSSFSSNLFITWDFISFELIFHYHMVLSLKFQFSLFLSPSGEKPW